MIISKADFINTTLQSTQRQGTEKPPQADGVESRAGTAERGAVSVSPGEVLDKGVITVKQVSSQQEAEPSAVRSIAPRMDRVEISKEGAAACARLQAQKRPSRSTDQFKTVDLSKYTKTELKQMCRKGEITRQQYEKQTGETLE